MDGNRFDDMVRAASARDSRRGALRALAGAALGALGLGVGEDAEAGCRGGRERCGGRCRPKCPDVMVRNRRTCRCECPEGMNRCGRTCVGADRCCPGEKECGGGCIREEDCCTHTHKECPDGSCIAKEVGACCPGVEVECPNTDGGCCNSFAGEVCSDDGCCNTLLDQAVCGGKCTDLGTNENCSACGDKCGRCETCRRDGNGFFSCVGPDSAPPACESCSNGQVVSGVSCGDRCCGPGTECCGGGCCAAGKCDSINGQTCCHRVTDNIPYCLVM